MKRLASLLASAFLAVCLTAEPASVLFTAAAFTKAQRNSSIPTDAGIFIRLPDQGWVPYGPKIQQVSSAAVDPADASRVFLACGNGVVRSLDGGKTWRQVTGWRESDITAIVIDPTDGQKVYASTGWGLIRSLDGGDSWTSIDEGLTEKFSRTIVLDAANPARLLAGTAGGLFVTENRGDTWQQVKGVPSAHVLRLRRGIDQPDTWLAVTEGQGAWLSTDDGESWQLTAPDVASANLYACAVDPHDARHLAIGGWDIGVWTSTDGGQSWQNRAEGLPSPNVLTLTFDPHHPGRVWAASFEEGTVFSDDSGKTWQDGGLDGSLTNDLGFLPLVSVER
jgi:photosystem II stability/assembly factor-like uncharacterized protein